MADPVIGPLSRVDHAFLDVGTLVPMDQHRNDEILSYMWRGLMVHEDSTGRRVELTPSRLMMMNAGRGFSHEESTPGVPVEMLQIFIRPQATDLEPSVQFHERLPSRAASGLTWAGRSAAERRSRAGTR
jgi:quercetin 2,3-dioxygenase